MNRDVIVALDFATREEAIQFLNKFDQSIYVKVGMELFYSAGPGIVKEIRKMGHKVFLDLKLHDIPNTVYGGIHSLLELGADMVNIHCAGGSKMIEEARRAIDEYESGSTLLGVTMLTSTSEKRMVEEIGINPDFSIEDMVLQYAKLGKKHGLHGIVCSAKEAQIVKKELGKDFVLVCPGIRPKGTQNLDQVRVVTPEDARDMDVDYIVVGRPIRQAKDPVQEYREICQLFLGDNK